MDLSNMLGGALGGADPGRLTAGVQDVFQSSGGVDGLIGKLRAGGMGSQVDSWISTGSNEPADPQQLGQALGPETTNRLASSTGLPVAELLPLLAQFLPMLIDHLTPGGQLPKGGGTGDIGDIGGLIGGMLGKR